MTRIVTFLLLTVFVLTVSGCHVPNTQELDTSVSSIPENSISMSSSSSIPLEEQPYDDVSLTFFGLLSLENGLSTPVTIVNNKSDVVAGIATCEEGTLNGSGKKSYVYFSEDKTGEVKYTVPNRLVDDCIVFNFYDANSKLVLTKSLMVIAGEDGFTLYEELGL